MKGVRHYLAFISRKLRCHERSYYTTEIEALAIVYALQEWKKILIGHRVIVRTDYRALIFMMTTDMASERVTRWPLFSQQFDIVIHHKPGNSNVLADTLSRFPEGEFSIMVIRLADEDHETLERMKHIRKYQQEDRWVSGIYRLLRKRIGIGDSDSQLIERLSKEYEVWGGIVYRSVGKNPKRLRIEMPEALWRPAIWLAHYATGHAGVDRTMAALCEKFTWQGMRVGINNEIRTCDLCQRSKQRACASEEA